MPCLAHALPGPCLATQEIQDLFLPAYVIKDPEAKAKARGEASVNQGRNKV